MKKVLSLVLAVVMMLSCFTVAFAAPEDVTDKDQQKAVDALISLGIVNGYEDGSYKPENIVTRAEMAKLIVTALGHGDLAAGSSSSFKDAQGKWYDGYVAMAAGLDIVTGYPDGTFKGENPVSYQEAVVMTLRALGYTNSAVNNGNDTYNASKYKALAATEGILDNIVFKSTGASRGDIAIMVYNALETNTVEINDKGLAEKIILSETVDKDSGKITKEYEVLLDRLADKDTVQIKPTHLNPNSKYYLGDYVDLTPYMYQNIVAYFNSYNEVIFVQKSLNPTVVGYVNPLGLSNIKYDANVNNIIIATEDEDVALEFPFDKDGKQVPIKVYVNGGEEEFSKEDFQITESGYGSLTYADITVVYDYWTDTVIGAVARQGVESEQVNKTYKSGYTKIGSFNLPKNSLGKVNLDAVKVTGAVTALEDIEVDDIISYYPAALETGSPSKVEIVVTRETIEGKVTSTALNGRRFVIDGQLYADYSGDVTVGSEGIFYLNESGAIIAFEGTSLSNTDYAMVVKVNPALTYPQEKPTSVLRDASIKLIDKNGKFATYTFDKDAVYFLDTNLDEDEKIIEANVFDDPDLQKLESDILVLRDNKFVITGLKTNGSEITEMHITTLEKNPIDPDSRLFLTSDNVTVFSIYSDTFEVVSADALNALTKGDYYSIKDDGVFTLIIANQQLMDNSNYAVITNVETVINDDNQAVKEVTAYIDGVEVKYLTESENIKVKTNQAELYALSLDGNLIVDDIDTAIGATVTSSAIGSINVKYDTFILNGDLKALSDNAVVYIYQEKTTTAGSYSFVRTGDVSDLDYENAEFLFYNLNKTADPDDEEFEIVIIKVAR